MARTNAGLFALSDNIDYNSLKHFIKVHTTKDEAKAIAIPGHTDTRLAKVEDDLYHELCSQHDRAGLFVSAKADEIDRRLRMFHTDPFTRPSLLTTSTNQTGADCPLPMTRPPVRSSPTIDPTMRDRRCRTHTEKAPA